jgi:hypothetical protein
VPAFAGKEGRQGARAATEVSNPPPTAVDQRKQQLRPCLTDFRIVESVICRLIEGLRLGIPQGSRIFRHSLNTSTRHRRRHGLLKDLRDEADGRLPESTALIDKLLAETDGDDFSLRTFVLASVARSMELEKRVLALERRLRFAADRLVSLTTSASPTPPGTVIPLSVMVKADGSTETFTLFSTARTAGLESARLDHDPCARNAVIGYCAFRA